MTYQDVIIFMIKLQIFIFEFSKDMSCLVIIYVFPFLADAYCDVYTLNSDSKLKK